MNYSTLIMIMTIGILVMAWYGNTSKRDKILCTFRRVNKTKVSKFVKMQSRYVIFDNHKYDIVPSRISFQWYTAGLVHMLFPQWVATLDFTDSRRLPLNTNTMDYEWDNPEVRNAINQGELVKSYFATASPKSEKKVSGLMQYLPIIAIVLVVLVAGYMYMQMNSLGQRVDANLGAIQNQIKNISK